MTDNLPAPRRAGPPAVRRELAERTAAMLGHREPRIRWRRRVSRKAQVWVRVDGPLVIDDELIEIATGAPLPARQSAFPRMAPYGDSGLLRRPQIVLRDTGPVKPWPGVRADPSDWRWCRAWRGLVVVGREEPGPMLVAGVHPFTGTVEWWVHARGDDAKMWCRWFADDLNGVGRLRHADEWTAPIDPDTRRPRWRVTRGQLHGAGGQGSAAPDAIHIVYDEKAGTFTGLGIDDGAVRWSTEPIPEATAALGAVRTKVVHRRLIRENPPQEDVASGCSTSWKDVLAIDATTRPSSPLPSGPPRPLSGEVRACTYDVSSATDARAGELVHGVVLDAAEVDAVNAALQQSVPDTDCDRTGHRRFVVLSGSQGPETYVALDGCAVQQGSDWWRGSRQLRAILSTLSN